MNNIKNIFEFSKQKKEEYLIWKKVINTKDDVKGIKYLLNKNFKHNKKANLSFNSSYSKTAKPYPIDKRQRVTFKMTNSRNKGAHNTYLSYYMPQKNKEYVLDKPSLFGSDYDEYVQNKTGLHFKCIISPENPDVDLVVLTKAFIKGVEYLTGYELYYEAAIHKDTNHPHVHVCINGKDKNGQSVYFQKELIKYTMRNILQQAATNLVGYRSKIDDPPKIAGRYTCPMPISIPVCMTRQLKHNLNY